MATYQIPWSLTNAMQFYTCRKCSQIQVSSPACKIRTMPALMRRLNYRHIILSDYSEHETVGVLRKDGCYRYVPWLGFLDIAQARGQGRPVKLEVIRVTEGDGLGDWQHLAPGEHAQGCLLAEGVYGVLTEGKPRVVY
jgi:hypothetical protein